MAKSFKGLQLPALATVTILSIFGISTSAFSFWIIESWIKYLLFTFQVLFVVVIYLILEGGFPYPRSLLSSWIRIQYSLHNDIVTKASKNLDIVFTSISSMLLFLNILRLDGGILQLFLAFLCSTILSGYVILKMCKINIYFSKLEIAILSFISSFLFSGLSSSILLVVDEGTRSFLIPTIFTLLGIGSIVLTRRRNSIDDNNYSLKQPKSLCKKADTLPLSLCILFYLFLFFIIYPEATLLPGTDASRHYSYSVVLSRTPDAYAGNVGTYGGDIYSGFGYFLFHAFQASLHVMSGSDQTVTQFQTVQVVLNLFLPISVYALASRFLGSVDKRIPALSTILYTTMSNFSFIYFVQLKLLNAGDTEFQELVTQVSEKSYDGIINFLQPFHFFTPLSVAYVFFMIALLLLMVPGLSRYKFIALYIVIIFALYYVHLPEAVIYVLFVSVFSFFSKGNNDLRLDDALIALLIGSIFASAFFGYTSFIWESERRDLRINTFGILSYILPVIVVLATITWRKKVLLRVGLPFNLGVLNNRKFLSALSVVLVSAYLLGLITWLSNGDFKTSLVRESGVVPWFIYPLILGMVGLLALVSIKFMGNVLPDRAVIMILSLVLFLFVMGRIVSFVSTNFIVIDYWEKRFVGSIFLFSCLLAPIPLIRFRDDLRLRMRKPFADTPVIIMICLIVLSGYSSIVLQSEYWFIRANESSEKISEKEIQAVGYLRNVLQKDKYAYTISPTTKSREILAFAAPAYQSLESNLLVSSKFPDIGLISLSNPNLDHAYLYMHDRDNRLVKENPQGWLTGHILFLLPIVYSNDEVSIYNITKLSYPSPKSDTVLVIPRDNRENSWFYAYDIISRASRNYTVMYDIDPSALKAKNIVLGYDPIEFYRFYENFSLPSSTKKWSVISGLWNQSLDGLHAKYVPNRTIENIILSPVTSPSKNFDTSTSFVATRLSNNRANYVSIIYSWINQENYNYAGILFQKNSTFLYFTTVRDGVRSQYPLWPGLEVDLNWKPGDLINMTLSKHGNIERLTLNGTEYLNRHLYNINAGETKTGYVGLSSSRIIDVAFDDFSMRELEPLNARNPLDYLKYVQSGGTLTVVNTSGYPGYFANSLIGPEGLKETPSNMTSIPIFERAIGQGKFCYINLEPKLSEGESGEHSRVKANKTLDMISTFLADIQRVGTPSPNLKEIAALFRELNGTSSGITVNATAILFPHNLRFDEVTINYGNNSRALLHNITKLDFDHYNRAILQANKSHFSLSSGRGLYSTLEIRNVGSNENGSSILVEFQNTANALVSTSKLSRHFSNISSIQVIDRNAIVFDARQPTVNILSGNTFFSEFYPREGLYEKTGAIGHGLNVRGNMSISLYMSDSYKLAHQITIDGNVQRLPSLAGYDEQKSYLSLFSYLPQFSKIPIFVLMLVAVPFLISAVLIVYERVRIGRISR